MGKTGNLGNSGKMAAQGFLEVCVFGEVREFVVADGRPRCAVLPKSGASLFRADDVAVITSSLCCWQEINWMSAAHPKK
jgi:hypothetical protein